MVERVIPYINQELASNDQQVELEDGRVILIDPEGLVALALQELGAKLVDVESRTNSQSFLKLPEFDF